MTRLLAYNLGDMWKIRKKAYSVLRSTKVFSWLFSLYISLHIVVHSAAKKRQQKQKKHKNVYVAGWGTLPSEYQLKLIRNKLPKFVNKPLH